MIQLPFKWILVEVFIINIGCCVKDHKSRPSVSPSPPCTNTNELPTHSSKLHPAAQKSHWGLHAWEEITGVPATAMTTLSLKQRNALESDCVQKTPNFSCHPHAQPNNSKHPSIITDNKGKFLLPRPYLNKCNPTCIHRCALGVSGTAGNLPELKELH